jgi:hypothetical protein
MSRWGQDFAMFTGETKRLRVQVYDQAGDPFDLSSIVGIQWEMQRDLTTNGGADLTKQLGDGITITDPVGGLFQIDIDPSDTVGLAGQYTHEARIVDGSGHVATVFVGRAALTKTAIG